MSVQICTCHPVKLFFNTLITIFLMTIIYFHSQVGEEAIDQLCKALEITKPLEKQEYSLFYVIEKGQTLSYTLILMIISMVSPGVVFSCLEKMRDIYTGIVYFYII